jgi:hypothetical protein
MLMMRRSVMPVTKRVMAVRKSLITVRRGLKAVSRAHNLLKEGRIRVPNTRA